jgi:hypothetical protein
MQLPNSEASKHFDGTAFAPIALAFVTIRSMACCRASRRFV